ncbi:major capsid protein [uncultured Fusobacterium sp.]|uniref:major capsid protein n=1 Tax=uncultured Fusobacterium sp. TaxID=159267 RepID=UPI0025FDFB53|nr:major capsid protein [uncultured Fusobacterium sp.]
MNSAKFSMKMPNRVVLDSNILPQAKGMKSTFDLSEGLKTCIDFDKLYPVYWEELSPGDHFEVDVASVCRLMPTVAPVMDNVKLKFFAFWVPNRLLWKHFLNFMGEKTWQDDHNDYLVPQLNMKVAENAVGGLADYLGCPPTGDKCDYAVSALPFRAYNKIWNDWYRASEIQEPLKEYTGDNLSSDKAEDKDTLKTYKILKKGKPLDYFTSCLPYPQSGESVEIPLVGDAVVRTNGRVTRLVAENANGNKFVDVAFNNNNYNYLHGQDLISVQKGYDTNLYADMSQVTGVTIEALRKASALQVLLERDARAGERYSELVKMHYDVTCPDFLLGRSQFLGSCTSDIVINPVVQNSSTNEISPQGHLTGIGVGQQNNELCEVSAVEHGIFMILACASADVTYQQGVARKFSKNSRWDYMNPAFWNLGDQAVYNKEIFLSPDKATNDAVFGYQERYRELREGVNKITGKMRSGVTESLDVWHLAEKFENLPKLNSTFIESNTPVDRVLSAPNEPDIIMDIWFDIKATRPLPVTADPSLLAGRI